MDPTSQASPSPKTSRPKRVLVVDDNVEAADILAELLRMGGVEVRVAHSGTEALAVGPEYAPNVILLDLIMQGMDGCEAAHRIRQEPWGKDVVLVAVLGWSRAQDIARAAGFDHTLLKPVEWTRAAEVLGFPL